MSAFNPAGLVREYGQLDTLLTDGQTPGSHADDLFLNMLDQYDQATGSDGYFDHDGMVDELLDALNRRLNPIGLEASRSAEAKTMRDASQALDGHDAAANERPLDR